MKGFIDINIVKDFIRYTKAKQYKNAQEVIIGVDFRTKANFYTLGNIILKDKAPTVWKKKMLRLLYADEHPFLYKKL